MSQRHGPALEGDAIPENDPSTFGAVVSGVVIATPAFNGQVHSEYAWSIGETRRWLVENDIAHAHLIPPNTGAIDKVRSELANDFIKRTNYSHLCFIDSDMSWDPKHFARLLLADKDIASAPYLKKQDPPDWTHHAQLDEENLIVTCPKTGFARARRLPCGLLMIKRESLERMIEHFDGALDYVMDGSEEVVPGLFETLIKEFKGQPKRWSEDFIFSERAKEAGLELWFDPESCPVHWGMRGFRGSPMKATAQSNEKPMMAAE